VLERRTLAGSVRALVSTRLEDAGFLVAFTERMGGVSHGPYRSLNLGLSTGDHRDRVRINRRRACQALGIAPFAHPHQVHGSRMMSVGPSRAGAGFEEPAPDLDGADALFTTSKGIPVAMLAADCVPVALAEPRTGALAVVHAGWRGIAAGVLTSALAAFDEVAGVRAAIGPSIGPDHYEVGEEVALAVSAATQAGAITRRSGPRLLLDLAGTVARVLEERGVRFIERTDLCTACETQRFFSYRRDGTTGRQALIAVRLRP
jgi:YfiH family protein